jgi:hypothetical protein
MAGVVVMCVAVAGCAGVRGGEATAAAVEPGTRLLQLGGETLSVETVFEDRFVAGGGNWLGEGARPEVRQGRLFIDARGPGVPGATVWCRRPFEGDVVIEYTVRVEKGEGNTNLNFIACATAADGKSVLDSSAGRTGAYGEYHAFPNYILTYLNSDDSDRQDRQAADPSKLRVRVRLRRDPGFRLLAEVRRPQAIEKGRDYRFAVVLKGPRTALFVDGWEVLGHTDAEPLPRRGHVAFRTWATHMSVSEFRVSRIVPAAAAPR